MKSSESHVESGQCDVSSGTDLDQEEYVILREKISQQLTFDVMNELRNEKLENLTKQRE